MAVRFSPIPSTGAKVCVRGGGGLGGSQPSLNFGGGGVQPPDFDNKKWKKSSFVNRLA